MLIFHLAIAQDLVGEKTKETSDLQPVQGPEASVLQEKKTANFNPEAAFPTMAQDGDRRRLLLWISACVLFVVFVTSIWYWSYLNYYQKESSRRSPPRMTERHDQQAESGAAQQRGLVAPPAQSGRATFDLDTFHGNPRWKDGGGLAAAMPVAAPPRSAARTNRGGGHQPDQVPTNMMPPLGKGSEGLARAQHHAGDRHAIEPATGGRRHCSVACSESSGTTPQMTPETGSSAAQTPVGQRTPLPGYTSEHWGTDPPVYAESEPGGHTIRCPPRRPTF